MPNYGRILEGLRRPPLLNYDDQFQSAFPSPSSGGVRQKPPELIVDAFNDEMSNELRNRAFQASRVGDSNEVGALAALLGSYQNERETGPLARQRASVNRFEDASQAAQLEGFATPQEAAAEARRGEDEKMRMPLEVARQSTRTALEQAEAQGRNTIALERERQRGLRDMLQGIGGRDISAIGRTGTGGWVRSAPEGQGQPKVMSGAAGLMGDLTNAASYYERSKETDQEPAAKAALDSARQQVLAARADVDPLVRGLASDIVNSPTYGGIQDFGTLQQRLLMQYGDDLADMTPNEWAQLDELVRQLRGR